MFQVSTRRFCSLRAFAPAALLLSGLAWVTTGCANMATTATETSGLGAAKGVMSGQVHGGNQAVIGADVRLYAAGTTGYGSSPTLYAETSTDSLGNFSFTKSGTGVQSGATTPTYGCPASGNPQMYIQALGGNTQGAGNPVNTAAGFVIAIGTCSTIGAQTFVAMNELTTVATLAALQQYFSPANANTDNINHFGLPSTTQAQAAFANSVALIPNMVSTTLGTVNTGSTVSATPTGATAPVSVTITPEVSKIDTIANIAAACVNSYPTTSGATVTQSTACTTLFSNAVPPNPGVTSQGALTLSTATDTMQAVYYMLTNPTDGGVAALKNLFALSSAQAPYQPSYSTAPTDWTVGIRYSSTSTCATGTANFLAYAYHLAVDAAGDLYAVSNATGGNLFELSPNGTPLTCALGATVGKSTGFAIDTTGNLWIGSGSNTNLFKYTPGGTTATAVATGETTGQVGTQFVAIDASNDVFASAYTTISGGNNLFELVNGAAGVAVSTLSAQNAGASNGTQPYFFAPDTSKRVFVSDSTTTNNFYDVYPVATADSTTVGGYDTSNIGAATTVTNIYGVAAGLSGTIAAVSGNYAASAVSNTLSIFQAGSGAMVGTPTITAQYAGGLVGPRELAIDGAGNIWSPSSTVASGNYVTGTTNAAMTYIVAEFTPTGNPLSPNSSPAATSTTTVNGGFQKDPAVLPVAPRGIAVDPSGNVWVGSNSSTGTGVLEIVGAAVPVVTPIASSLNVSVTAGNSNAVSKP